MNSRRSLGMVKHCHIILIQKNLRVGYSMGESVTDNA